MKFHGFSRIILCICILTLLSAAVPVHAAYDTALEQTIIQSCINNKPADLAQYDLSEEELEALFMELSYGGKLPWYAQDSYRYSFNDNGQILEFYPEYLSEEEYDRVLYETRVAEVIAEAVHAGMSQWQKALAVHDYLIANTCYDESYTYYDGYDLLVRGTAVCEGYSEAYMDIMNRLGVPCIMVISNDMDHSWNLVNLEGSWYHVDLTWDDPYSDVYGQVLHDYFLLTDQEMHDDHQARLADGEEGHYNWITDLVCDDETYCDAFWKEVDSQICYLDSYTSYLRREKDWDSCLYLRDEATGSETRLFTDEEEYIDVGSGKYSYEHLGLSLWNGRLYFSSTDTVYSMALDGSDVEKEYMHDTKKETSFIYSCFVKNDTLYLTLSDHDFNETTKEVALPATGYHVHKYTQTEIHATCLEDGQFSRLCSCGIYVQLPAERATGHNYESITEVRATLFRPGRTRYTCTGCQDTYTSVVPRLSFLEWLFSFLL